MEIGCGRGETSLALAREGRFAMALDFAAESLNLVHAVANRLKIDLATVMADATLPLPLKEEKSTQYFKQDFWSTIQKTSRLSFLKIGNRFLKG